MNIQAKLANKLRRVRTYCNKPSILYALLALVILGPLLLPGYVLTLDMSWVPHIRLPEQPTNVYPLYLLLKGLSIFLPSDAIQKIVLFVIFWGAGYGAHRLYEHLAVYLSGVLPKSRLVVPAYFAGVFYMINPFTYERFMDGHWLVLLGYALLPWFVRSVAAWIVRPNLQNALKSLAWLLAIAYTSIHMILIAFIILLTALIASLVQGRRSRKKIDYKVAIGLLVIMGGCIIGNLFWLAPFAGGQTAQSQQISTFDDRQDMTFGTVGYGIVPPEINVLTLHGYWGETQDRFLLIQNAVLAWPLLIAAILGLVAVGFWRISRYSRLLAIAAAATACTGYVLSLGTNSHVFGWINELLQTIVPFFIGYRDAQKFAALLVLVYAVVGAFGVHWLIEKLSEKRTDPVWTKTAAFLALSLPVMYGSLLLFGTVGQLKSSNYPADWYELNGYIRDRAGASDKVLFLPWRLYMHTGWAGRTIANPAERFFDADVIQSDDAVLGLIPNQSKRYETKIVERSVLPGSNHERIIQELRDIDVKYIVVAKLADWKEYGYLDDVAGLTKIRETAYTITYSFEDIVDAK